MNIATALRIVKSNIEALRDGAYVAKATVLSGKPGIGKTERMRDMSNELGMSFYHVSAPELSPEQLSGIPEFNSAKGFEKYHVNGIDVKATYWSVPEIIYNANTMAEENRNGVVLMLDDIHEAPMATVSYFYQLLNERKLSNYKLADNVFIVGAMNDSESAGFEGLPSPIKNRISILKVDLDTEEWLKDYAFTFHHHIRSFVRENRHFLSEEERTEIEQFGSPRSWTALNGSFSRLYESDRDFTLEHIGEIAAGYISQEAAMAFEKHVMLAEKLDLSSFVRNKVIKDMNEENALDQILYSYLVNYIVEIEDVHYLIDLINANTKNQVFVGHLMAEVYNKSLIKDKGLEISKGIGAFLNVLLEDDKYLDVKLTDKEEKVLKKLKLTDKEKNVMLKVMSMDHFEN